MDDATAREGHEIVTAAREWLREWIEEGVDHYDGPQAAAMPEAAPASPEARPIVAPPDPPAEGSAAPAASAPRGEAGAVGSGVGPAGAPSPSAGGAPHAQLGARPSLDEVRELLGDCTRCGLCQGRSQIVFGDGNPDADLMFVGEGPGEQEDRQGLPFVGRAGELLTQMIERGIEIPRGDVYICNIVKCRPPRNRTPLPDEVASCRPFLDGQIDAVRPRVIVTLGKPAASLLLGRDVAITRVRGTWQEYRGIPLMPTLHPAYILRQYTPENRRLVWQDLKAAVTRIREG